MKNTKPSTGNIPLNDMWKWNYVEGTIHRVMSYYNYKETRPPILLSNDVIKKIYRSGDKNKDFGNFVRKLFRIDSEEQLSLRPDGTVTYLSEFSDVSDNSKVNRIYYIGPMFRRSLQNNNDDGQFHQFGAEALGSCSYIIDIEVIRLGLDIFRKFGLSDIHLELSNFGCPECRPHYIKDLKEYWQEAKTDLCPDCSSDFTKYKSEGGVCQSCQNSWQKGPAILDYLCPDCCDNFSLIKKGLANLMVNYTVNPNLNMSFDYYNRIVFKYRAGRTKRSPQIGGGGRYDYLAQSITGKPLYAIGLSTNIEDLISVLEKKKLFPQPIEDFRVFIKATHPDLEITLLQIVQELHDNEISVIIGNTDPDNRKLKETALNEGASLIIILDNILIREGKATVNNLVKMHQEKVNIRDILDNILRLKKALT